MLDLYIELKAVVAALETARVPFALCGGLALAVYGRPRATVDIDLLVPGDSVDAAFLALSPLGFDIAALPMEFGGGRVEIRRVSKVDAEAEDLLSVDLLIVTSELSAVWDSRRMVAWEGSWLPIVSPEGLIHLKELRGSGQDKDDIEALRGIDEG